MRKERHDEVSRDCSAKASGHGAGRAGARLLGWTYAALTFTLAVVVAFGAFVPRAFAANQYNPEMVIDDAVVGDNAGSTGYMCVNANRFTATLELIGKMGEYVSIDDVKYTRLITSGGFKDAMDRWNELTGSANEEVENTWLGGDGFVDGWLIISGKGNCWYGTFTEQQIANALAYFQLVMSGGGGGSSGGGGSTVPDQSGYTHFDYGEREGSNVTLYTTNGSNTITLQIPSFTVPDGNVFVAYGYYDGSSTFRMDILYLPEGSGLYYPNNYNQAFYYYAPSRVDETIRQLTYSKSGDTWNLTNNRGNSLYYARGFNLLVSQLKPVYGCIDDGTVPEPDPEPKPEPEPDVPGPSPTAPEPPDLPDIGDPTVPHEPDPTPPTTEPTPPTLPTPITVTVPTNTTPTDYTPWLRAILEELKNINAALNSYLQSIIDEMAEHCQHIRDEMGVQAAYLGECLGSVASTAAGVGDQVVGAIHDYSEWLSEYLDGLAEWMVEHMSFDTTVENNVTNDPYDDTSLLYWLKRIYTRLGAGQPVNSKPTDPTTDPKGTDDWLTRLWQNFLTALNDLIPSDDLGDDLDTLKTKFPFSIPWDVLAIMTMLVAPAQTPEVDIPQYALDANGDIELVGTYELDLEDYDAAMGGVRLILKIAFVVFLMVHTKDFMELIEAVIPV